MEHEAKETLGRLRRNHLDHLSGDDQVLLVALVAGIDVRTIASSAYRAERTVRRDLQRLLELICLPAGSDRGRSAMAGWWVREHIDCPKGCLAFARELMAERSEMP